MMHLFLLLFLCHVSSPVKHSMMFYIMMSSGVPNAPDYLSLANVDEAIVAYYDSNMKTPEPRQDWVRKLIEDDRQGWERGAQYCINYQLLFNAEMDSFMQRLNQTGGVHIFQQMVGCEWDDETKKVDGYNQYGYNGKTSLRFDLKTEAWIAANPKDEITKKEKYKATDAFWKNFLTHICPAWLGQYLKYGKSVLLRTDLPSVSLLQKSPSSPISCHATGFYPDRAMMFWRKDGEELHEDVDIGEILLNQDGSFQMSADLNISSVAPEDWRRYDCVFQLSGVKDDIITRLDKAVIRTNWFKTVIRNGNEEPSDINIPITAAVVALAVVVIAAVGFTVYKKRKAPVNSSELSERLNPETPWTNTPPCTQ